MICVARAGAVLLAVASGEIPLLPHGRLIVSRVFVLTANLILVKQNCASHDFFSGARPFGGTIRIRERADMLCEVLGPRFVSG